MLKSTALQHFGGSVTILARAINVTRAAIYQWPDVVPEGSAYKLQAVTGGELKVDPAMYRSASKSAQTASESPTDA